MYKIEINKAGWKVPFRKWKVCLFGNREKSGGLITFVTYFLLINIALIYLNPIIYMISTSLKGVDDILDATVGLIPRHPTFDNVFLAFEGLEYFDALRNTLLVVLPSALGQVVSCGIAGYAFARLEIPCKKILFFILIITFIVPPQTIIIPLLIMYKNLHLINSPFPFILPAMVAQGLNAPLFVIIYMQYFKNQPREIEDAARVDGSGVFRIFWKVMFPMAKPAMIVVFLFSVVWHWNETFLYLFLNPTFRTLSLKISDLKFISSAEYSTTDTIKNAILAGGITTETVMMAGCFITILPTLLLFFVTQKWFTHGIERTGLVE